VLLKLWKKSSEKGEAGVAGVGLIYKKVKRRESLELRLGQGGGGGGKKCESRSAWGLKCST